jgi:hypothetical protein
VFLYPNHAFLYMVLEDPIALEGAHITLVTAEGIGFELA